MKKMCYIATFTDEILPSVKKEFYADQSKGEGLATILSKVNNYCKENNCWVIRLKLVINE